MVEAKKIKYDVALSYASEQSAYACDLTNALKNLKVKTFFAEHEQERLFGKNLIEELEKVYLYETKFIIILASKDYVKKEYPEYERRIASFRQLKDERLFIIKFDEVHLPGINPSIVYMDGNTSSPQEVAKRIAAILKKKF